jgi:polyisoprenoid-binding protein YceI
MKAIWGVIIGIALVVLLAWYFWGSSNIGTEPTELENASGEVVPQGTYTVDTARSDMTWAGKKPLIDGYINSGTIGLSSGTMTVGEGTATGSFTIDMNTIQVGLTATKPGSEGALENHLKGKGWFDVATHPTAMFVITGVTPMDDSDTTLIYTVTGNLTLKGITNEISFPAKISFVDGELRAEAQTEIDRTRWGLTAGSGNFFENLGDNLIADEIAIGFSIIATPQ